jgi:hypothetical protein
MEDGKSGSVGRGKRRNEVLFASKLALTCDSLVSFGGALDPILKLAVTLRQLLGYYVAAANCTAVERYIF